MGSMPGKMPNEASAREEGWQVGEQLLVRDLLLPRGQTQKNENNV